MTANHQTEAPVLDHPQLMHQGHGPQTLVTLFQQRSDSARTLALYEARGNEREVTLQTLSLSARARLAQWQSRGAIAGQAIILLCEDRLAFLEAFWAATLGGLIPVPVSSGISDEHRSKVLRIASRLDSPWIFTDTTTLDRLAQSDTDSGDSERAASVAALSERQLPTAPAEQKPEDARLHSPQPNDIALIQFSSGSTSAPKGVVLTHRNLLTNLDAIMHGMQIRADDRMMSWMPLTHDMGLIGFHLVPIAADIDHVIVATDVFVRRPTLWLSVASERHVTVLCSPNFGYAHLLKSFRPEKCDGLDLSAVRLVFNGAEPISTALINQFNTSLAPFGLPANSMFPVYGLAEASLAVCFPPIGRAVHHQTLARDALGVGQKVRPEDATGGGACFVSVGSCVRHVDVRIAGADGATLPDEHVGHLLIRGASVTSGYLVTLGESQLDRTSIDDEHWLDTGDLGFTSDGELYITGRAKDIIFANGQNLYPHDLENTLVSAGVVDAGKVAVAARPDDGGDQLCVFVLHRGSVEAFTRIRDDVVRELALRAGAAVDLVIPVQRIPKTTSGKIQRFRLVEELIDGEHDAGLANLPAPVTTTGLSEPDHGGTLSMSEQLLRICNTRIADQSVSPVDNLFELGISSLTLAEIHADIESAWPGRLDITDLFDYPTVAEIATVLEERAAVPASVT